MSTLLGRHQDVTSATHHTADGFATFFVDKVERVRSDTAGLPPPLTIAPASFLPCIQANHRDITGQILLTGSRTLVVREYIDVLLPYITRMVNRSLSQGRLPVSQKHASITPLLKKPGLDSSDMNNFPSISNLSFISKVVTSQLHQYLAANNLLPRFQSVYRKIIQPKQRCSRLQHVWSDILMAADERRVTLLGFLDLSAAFDCIDHSMLMDRLQSAVGLSDSVLDWVRSLLTDIMQQIAYSGQLNYLLQPLLFGVPQGSVLGPLLYLLYTAELALVVAHHGLNLHQYAGLR